MKKLANQKFKAKRWDASSIEVSGTLNLLDYKTLEPADPNENLNGYVMVIVNDEGNHIVDPNSVELI